MNTKVITITAILLIASAGALFAQQQAWGSANGMGSQAAQTGPMMQRGAGNWGSSMGNGPGTGGDVCWDGRGGGGRAGFFGGRRPFADDRGAMRAAMQDGEEVDLTGTIQLEEDELPLLRVGSDEYTLIIPPALAGELDLSSGARVTVEGLAISHARLDLTGDETAVHVRVMQVGNTRYVAGGPRW